MAPNRVTMTVYVKGVIRFNVNKTSGLGLGKYVNIPGFKTSTKATEYVTVCH